MTAINSFIDAAPHLVGAYNWGLLDKLRSIVIRGFGTADISRAFPRPVSILEVFSTPNMTPSTLGGSAAPTPLPCRITFELVRAVARGVSPSAVLATAESITPSAIAATRPVGLSAAISGAWNEQVRDTQREIDMFKGNNMRDFEIERRQRDLNNRLRDNQADFSRAWPGINLSTPAAAEATMFALGIGDLIDTTSRDRAMQLAGDSGVKVSMALRKALVDVAFEFESSSLRFFEYFDHICFRLLKVPMTAQDFNSLPPERREFLQRDSTMSMERLMERPASQDGGLALLEEKEQGWL